MQNFQVKPSEADKEAPYIQRNINETRDAYGLTSSNVKVTQYATTTTVSASALTNSTAIGAGVRLLDNAVLPPTYNQLQQFRNFYNIDKLDVDRYVINGQEQDAVVATRELNLKGVPPAGRLEAAGSWNAMVTHRVKLASAADIDAEVKAWLKKAYDAA